MRETPEEIRVALSECVKARNVLAHHYFWERAGHFALIAGQRQMLTECDAYNDLFENAERQIDAFLEPYRRAIGITHDLHSLLLNKVIKDAQASMDAAKRRTSANAAAGISAGRWTVTGTARHKGIGHNAHSRWKAAFLTC